MENCKAYIYLSWEDLGYYFSEFSTTANTVIAYSPLTQRVYRKKGIFDKGFCDKGSNWEIYYDIPFGVKRMLSNSNGCQWILSDNNTVSIMN